MASDTESIQEIPRSGLFHVNVKVRSLETLLIVEDQILIPTPTPEFLGKGFCLQPGLK